MLTRLESEGEREGCLRIASGRDGNRQVERLLETAPERHSYRYGMEESAMPVRDYSAEFQARDNGDGTSTVVWSVEFGPISDSSKTVETIRRFLKAGLDNIVTMHGEARA